MNPRKWYNAIGWTHNALGNCLAVPEFSKGAEPKTEFSQFADELERRVDGDVGPQTFDWIWDEVVRLSNYGKSYSDRFRPLTGGQLKDPGNFEWAGIPKWPFISSGSSIFHKTASDCGAKIPRGSRQYYSTYQDAVANGKQPCPVCRPVDSGEPATGQRMGDIPSR